MSGPLPPIFHPGAVGAGASFRRPIIQARLDAVHANFVDCSKENEDGGSGSGDSDSDDSDNSGNQFVVRALITGFLPSRQHIMNVEVGQTWFARGMANFPITIWTQDLPPVGPWQDPRYEMRSKHFKRVIDVYRGCRDNLSGNKVAVHLNNDAQPVQIVYGQLC